MKGNWVGMLLLITYPPFFFPPFSNSKGEENGTVGLPLIIYPLICFSFLFYFWSRQPFFSFFPSQRVKEPRWRFNQSTIHLLLCGFSSWMGEGSDMKGFHQSWIHFFFFFFSSFHFLCWKDYFLFSIWRGKRRTTTCNLSLSLNFSTYHFHLLFSLFFFNILCHFM